MKSDKNIIQLGHEVIEGEKRALEALNSSLNEAFITAVEALISIPPTGRVIISGMGKTGFIAMKISATLASTGVPSYFLHPAEALHGDLGRLTRDDIAILLSNSGETEETLRMVGLIKRIGCMLISITGNPSSSLSRLSDIPLFIGDIKEVCPLGLAPTASTTAMLVLGDALAMTILAKRDFTKEQFATYHPAGNLGRQLMRADEVMRTGALHTVVNGKLSTLDALKKMNSTKGRPGAASIIDDTGKLIGFFSDGDLVRQLENGQQFLTAPVSTVMTPNPKTVNRENLVQDILFIMEKHKIDLVIVIDENTHPIGLVDVQDLLDVRVMDKTP